MKKILFVCVENSCRSQIAEGFARYLGKGIADVYSAGSNPSGIVNPSAIEVMKESGVDISPQGSKGFKGLGAEKFDFVITLGCGDVCPFVPALQHIEWKIEDPKGRGIEAFRQARDTIRDKVQGLLRDISRKTGDRKTGDHHGTTC